MLSQLQEMFKSYAIPYVEYLLLNKSKYTFKIFMWHMCFFKQLVQLGLFSVLCVCVRGVCVCVFVISIVFCIFDALQPTPLPEFP